MSPNSLAAARKKSLVNKLDDIAKKSPVHVGYSGYNGGHLNGSYRNGGGNSSLTSSPYKSFSASPLSAKYTAASPARGHGFDPRTFTRSSAARAGAYSIPPEEE